LRSFVIAFSRLHRNWSRCYAAVSAGTIVPTSNRFGDGKSRCSAIPGSSGRCVPVVIWNAGRGSLETTDCRICPQAEESLRKTSQRLSRPPASVGPILLSSSIAPVIRRIGPPNRWLEPSGDQTGALNDWRTEEAGLRHHVGHSSPCCEVGSSQRVNRAGSERGIRSGPARCSGEVIRRPAVERCAGTTVALSHSCESAEDEPIGFSVRYSKLRCSLRLGMPPNSNSRRVA